MNLAIVIPVFNEGKLIRKTIDSIPRKVKGVKKVMIVAVNDGSTDNSETEIYKTRAVQIRHYTNFGVGAATVTGLEAAKISKADIIVTMDGDGQHSAKDIPRIIEPIINKKADLVIGSRLIKSKGMPLTRIFGNRFFNIITFLLSGTSVTDSQSGMRAMSQKLLGKLNLETMGYEISSEIILESAKAKARIKEVPIKAVYTSYSRSKGQTALNGINLLSKLFLRKIRG